LLGPFAADCDGEPVPVPGAAARALLGHLVLEPGRPHARDRLARMLWPELPQAAASNNLRQAVFRLRAAVPEAALSITRGELQLVPGLVAVDVTRFEDLVAEVAVHAHPAGSPCDSCAQRLREAAGLYRGELLEGLFLPHSPAMEDWVRQRREHLHRTAVQVLHGLAAIAGASGDHAGAAAAARRQLELDPCREQAHRQLMRALAGSGDRAAALAQYQRCRRVLDEELGVEPDPATRALYERIRSGAGSAPRAPRPGPPDEVPEPGPLLGRAPG
jgi:DNA-binding SARP family transcriptional activator